TVHLEAVIREEDPNAEFLDGVVENVGLVSGAVHPGLDQGAGRREAEAEVLAHRPERGARAVAQAEGASGRIGVVYQAEVRIDRVDPNVVEFLRVERSRL